MTFLRAGGDPTSKFSVFWPLWKNRREVIEKVLFFLVWVMTFLRAGGDPTSKFSETFGRFGKIGEKLHRWFCFSGLGDDVSESRG